MADRFSVAPSISSAPPPDSRAGVHCTKTDINPIVLVRTASYKVQSDISLILPSS